MVALFKTLMLENITLIKTGMKAIKIVSYNNMYINLISLPFFILSQYKNIFDFKS